MISDHKCVGKVINEVGPHAYQVETKTGILRHNCHHLIALPDNPAGIKMDIDVIPDLPDSSHTTTNDGPEPPTQPSRRVVYTRSGRVSRPPNRFKLDN